MIKRILLTFLLTFSFWIVNFGQIKLPSLVSDGMVLQRNQPVKIWGYASPNSKVAVTFLQKTYQTFTDSDSLWYVTLPQKKAGGPFTMKIEGESTIEIKDIVIGDVFLCSGQSNMETTMERLQDKYSADFNILENTNIRQFYVPRKSIFGKPQKDIFEGSWASYEGKNRGAFSAVAYFFAKELYQYQKVPIGIINCTLGGSPAEAWVSEDYLKDFDRFQDWISNSKNSEYLYKINRKNKSLNDLWHLNLKIEEQKTSPLQPWKFIALPDTFKNQIANHKAGKIHFRKTFYVDSIHANQTAKLYLGNLVDADSTFINGILVGKTAYRYPPRRYLIPQNVLRFGENTIEIKMIDLSGNGLFVPEKPYFLIFNDSSKVDLTGNWAYKLLAQTNPFPEIFETKWQATGLFNGMIHPLKNLNFKSVLWYQGESNVDKTFDYEKIMDKLIENWRFNFQNSLLPFYVVQLPNFGKTIPIPHESGLANIRNQQNNLSKLPQVYVAPTLDLGEWNDIHPSNKKEVGTRLAHLGLKNEFYRFKKFSQSPVLKRVNVKNNKLILTFYNLNVKSQTIKNQFELSFKEGVFQKFVAQLKFNKAVIELPKNTSPKTIRYAWADNPGDDSIKNQFGLPLGSFQYQIIK